MANLGGLDWDSRRTSKHINNLLAFMMPYISMLAQVRDFEVLVLFVLLMFVYISPRFLK